MVPDAATRTRAARRYASVCVCSLLLAAAWVAAAVANRDQHGFPDPRVFFGGLAGLYAASFGLTWVAVRPAVRGLSRSPARPPRPTQAERLSTKESAETLAHIAVVSAGLAIGVLVLAFFRSPAICVFASVILGRAALVAGKAAMLRRRKDAVAAEPARTPDHGGEK